MRSLFALLFVLFVGGLGITVTAPATFEVERAASIDASPRRIYPLISDLHRWAKWSVWQQADSGHKGTYSGASSGRGAVYEWKNEGEVGRGRIEITGTRSPTTVMVRLDFVRPFEAQNFKVDFVPPIDIVSSGELVIAERGGSTVVTWTMRGKYSVPERLKALVARTDALLGHELELGLANLKQLAEG
jgi:hypothetical protein